MKRTCLFTKSANRGQIANDSIESAAQSVGTNPNNSGSIFDIDTSGSIFGIIPDDKNNSNWFIRNRNAIGAGVAGLGSGMLLTAYIMQKSHDKDMKRLIQKKEKQKEENNKTE